MVGFKFVTFFLPLSLLYNWYRVFPGGKERLGRDAYPSPPSSAIGHERVELYLYSPMGHTACTKPQCTYKGALYLYLCFHFIHHVVCLNNVCDYGTRLF
jgi:hypothetical protein